MYWGRGENKSTAFSNVLWDLSFYLNDQIQHVVSTLFLKPHFSNGVSQTQWREDGMGPVVFPFNWRGVSHTGTACRGCITRFPGCFWEVSPLWQQHCTASPSAVPASWPCFRTALAVVNSLFGKTIAHSNAVIKIHDGNEKKKSIKSQSLDCTAYCQSLHLAQRRISESNKVKSRGVKLSFLMRVEKDD